MKRTKAQLEARLDQEQIITERLKNSVNHLADQVTLLQQKVEDLEAQRDKLITILYHVVPE